jgi:hypothetical protein
LPRTRALLLTLAGLAALVVLFFVFRPDDDGAAEPELRPPPTGLIETETETSASTETATETATEPAPPPPPPPPPPVETVRIHVRGGNVLGGLARPTFQRGDRVVLHVSSDVADHVHLHGYDLMRDVAPGSPARIRFRATLTGRFEVELEDRGLQIAEIEVRP